MLTIYLDQNKWIDIAREMHGLDPRHDLRGTVGHLQRLAASGEVCFPLSLGHYIETGRASDPGRRLRLADAMRAMSRDVTLASPTALVGYEFDRALLRYFPKLVEPRPFQLLGDGYRHACDYRVPPPRVPPAFRGAAERAMLSGVAQPLGLVREPHVDPFGARFMKHLNGVRSLYARAEGEERENVFYFLALTQVIDGFNDAIMRHGISKRDIENLHIDRLKALIDTMPTLRISMYLHRQWVLNKQLKASESDLCDWFYVGAAAAYCDVVVTEKRFADFMNRKGVLKRAVVITDLRELPGALVSLN